MRKAKSLRNIIVVLVSNLKPGETVKIYEDPWTQKKLEGEAKLIELLQQDSDREYWLVEFTRGHERHPRWIKKKTEGHHSSNPNGGTLCERLQHFIDEEEKGIAEYEEFVGEFHSELAHVVGADTIRYYGFIRRIIEEQRSHVEMLKRIKEVMCP